ncbi:hypothetical protein [Nocardioides sp. SYSU D00065]|uniref:hypothetical protein n=1 Tax=Nocardioides sp. SYSU D00065 TaxID=2817378 RepID=UPI001B342FA1|nr:hypothetical protein [Nocardioides sp. SYSU D00065]
MSAMIGLWGLQRSARANGHAAEALELARAAEARADKLARIQLERHDVAWVQSYDKETATLSFRNVGTDVAHKVALTVDGPDGSRQVTELVELHPTHPIGIRLTALAEDANRRWKELLDVGYIGVPAFTVRARLNWETGEGQAKTQEWEELVL